LRAFRQKARSRAFRQKARQIRDTTSTTQCNRIVSTRLEITPKILWTRIPELLRIQWSARQKAKGKNSRQGPTSDLSRFGTNRQRLSCGGDLGVCSGDSYGKLGIWTR
uniref:Uncharacterized protein n=1 Tax=Anisakis simplex TaxID=6269 RepID=A0A0M3JK75_ANISI